MLFILQTVKCYVLPKLHNRNARKSHGWLAKHLFLFPMNIVLECVSEQGRLLTRPAALDAKGPAMEQRAFLCGVQTMAASTCFLFET